MEDLSKQFSLDYLVSTQKERSVDYELNRLKDIEDKYNQLIYAVCRKFPNESRHETALRYIKEAETISTEVNEQPKSSEWMEPKFEKKEWYITPITPNNDKK